MNRMKKLQRAKRLVQDDEEQLTRKPAKKRKSDIFENVWSLKPAIPDGDTIETLKEYVKRMAATLKKKTKGHKITSPAEKLSLAEDANFGQSLSNK